MVGVELGETEPYTAVGRITVGPQDGPTREIGVAIHADGLAYGLSHQFRHPDVPFQPQGIGRGHREARAVVVGHHLELVRDGRDGVQIEHELVRLERRRLIVEHALAKEATRREEHPVVETAQVTVQGIRVGLALANLMDEAQRKVVHHHKRLDDVGHDAARIQLSFETHIAHG